MNTKLKTLTVLFAVAMMAVFTSCSNDVTPPIITGLEIGANNSLVGEIGEELHLEAEIEAEGKIALITVDIHNEAGSGDEIEAEFTDYEGMKSATFHKHVLIPEGVAAGEYHFHLTVTDQEGNSTTVEEDVTFEE